MSDLRLARLPALEQPARPFRQGQPGGANRQTPEDKLKTLGIGSRIHLAHRLRPADPAVVRAQQTELNERVLAKVIGSMLSTPSLGDAYSRSGAVWQGQTSLDGGGQGIANDCG
jgi:hypothetical protein